MRRRSFFKKIVSISLASIFAALSRDLLASEIVNQNDSQAIKLGYVENVNKINRLLWTGYKSGDCCKNCVYYEDTGKEYSPCKVFRGNLVRAEGWCDVFKNK